MDGLGSLGSCKEAADTPGIGGCATRAAAAARRARLAGALLLGLLSGSLIGPLTGRAYGEASWPTYHHDAARSGVDPETLNPITPSFAWQSANLGASIWSQPLIVGSRVYVATLANQVYALDATTGAVIWEQNAGVPVPRDPSRCQPSVGIVGTPVIDTSTGTLYAVADTWDASTEEAHHLLEGFKVANGERVLSIPVDPPGANAKTLLERPALNLDEGKVVFGFGGNPGDCGVYNGAVVAAPENGSTPSYWQYKPAAPAYGGGAVWAPSGATVDSAGHVYISTGNPNFPDKQEVSTYDHSDSLLKLDSSMSLLGSFAPESWLSDSNNDRDLGSAGPALLPGGLLFQAGKNEMGYLIEAATIGSGAPPLFSEKVCKGVKEEGGGEGSFGGDAYAAGTIYVPCVDGIRALSYHQATHSFNPLWHGPADAIGPPILSAGLVWVVTGKFLQGEGTKLYGLDPATGLARYTEALPSPTADHFASPSAAEGRVFVATGSSITAYQVAEALPSVTTGEASSLTPTSATLGASVNPNGPALKECFFEYGPTASYGASTPCSSLPPAGKAAVAVSAALHGLIANSTYHFRILATNQGGTSEGKDETFQTPPEPPSVLTEAASSLTEHTATLNASVNPNGTALKECFFEYGPTVSYGTSVACSSLPTTGKTAVAVSAALHGLVANSSYHFHIVASSLGGTSEGKDETFQTPPEPPSVLTEAASSLTENTATLSATVDPNGATVTDCHFEYGTTSALGTNMPCTSTPGAGTSAVAVSATLTGLTPDTSYYFRIAATNAGGTSLGAPLIMKTPAPPPSPSTSSPPPAEAMPGPTLPSQGKQGVLSSLEEKPPSLAARLLSASLRGNPAGVIKLRLSCPSRTSRCSGTVTLRTLHGNLLTLKAATFKLTGGQQATLKLRLTTAARKLIARSRTLRVRATITPDPASGAPTTVTPIKIRP